MEDLCVCVPPRGPKEKAVGQPRRRVPELCGVEKGQVVRSRAVGAPFASGCFHRPGHCLANPPSSTIPLRLLGSR